MPKKLVSITKIEKGQVFHFKNSLRPFITFEDTDGHDSFFLDVDEMVCYTYEELKQERLEFYHLEDTHLGVEVDGKVEWVS